MLEASGARLREVGATNKTTLDDYASAIGPETALILRVHQSNFYIGGFAGHPPNEAIAELARRRKLPFVVDLGSGALSATEALGLSEHEPTPAETLKQGAALVCFSGDKLLGGPQAGIIAGRARLISALKREPIFRALRCDKMVFAALEATIDFHLAKANAEVPALHLLALPNDELRTRGEKLLERLRALPLAIRLVESKTEVGGGALPRSIINSIALEISSPEFSPDELAMRLRQQSPATIGYVAQGQFKLDLRTILPEQDELVVAALNLCIRKPQG
jgi:L-seryl-tRNA(Ser) seleniumtransferase